MNILTELLEEAHLGDPGEPTDAERIEHEIYKELMDQQIMPSGVPAIALKALLLERFRSKTTPDEQDIRLGNWLIEIDHSRETLELIVVWFKGTPLEVEVEFILG